MSIESGGKTNEELESRLREAMAPEPADSPFEPRRRGWLLPIVVSLGVAFGLGLLAFFLFQHSPDPFVSPDLETRRFLTTEWRLLEELQSDLQFQLSLKEAEIARFQDQIAGLNQQNQLLRNAIESSVEARRQQLSEARRSTLERRRQQWSAEGLSADEIDRRSQDLQARLAAEDARVLEQYREDVEADFAAELEAVFDERQSVQVRLAQAQAEREDLISELDRTRRALESELEAARSAFSQERALLVRDLRSLAEERRRTQMVQDVLQQLYEQTVRAIDTGDYSEARARLDEILLFLGEDDVVGLEAVQSRLPVDQALVALLREVVARRESLDQQESANLENIALRLLIARQLVRDARRAEAEGNREAAENGYLRALEVIPEAQEAAVALEALRMQEQREDAEQLLQEDRYRELILLGDESYRDLLEAALDGLEEVFAAEAERAATEQRRQVAELQQDVRRLQTLVEREMRIAREARDEVTEERALRVEIQARLQEREEVLGEIDEALQALQERVGRASRGTSPEEPPASSPADLLLALVDTLVEQTEDRGLQAGREELAGEIALLARYLRGEPLPDPAAARRDIVASADQDPVFGGTAVDVQELGIAGLSRGELPLGQRRLLGFVTAVDGATVEVEPLGSLEAEQGQRAYVSSVTGSIQEVTPNRVLLEIDPEDGGAIAFRDLVYLEIRAQ